MRLKPRLTFVTLTKKQVSNGGFFDNIKFDYICRDKSYFVLKCLIGISHPINSHIRVVGWLTLKAPIATKVVCFSRLLKCLRSLYDRVDPDQTALIGAV